MALEIRGRCGVTGAMVWRWARRRLQVGAMRAPRSTVSIFYKIMYFSRQDQDRIKNPSAQHSDGEGFVSFELCRKRVHAVVLLRVGCSFRTLPEEAGARLLVRSASALS